MDEGLIAPAACGENADDLKQRIWKECKLVWRISFPAILAKVTAFGVLVVTQAFMGYIGDLEISTYAIVQILIFRFVNGMLIGMSSATSTLCAQAYGAGHYHMMGIYLQRSWVVVGVTATLVLPLFIFATPICRFLGQQEDIAVAARELALWFIPILYSYVFTFPIQMYLQSQLKNKIIGWFSTASFTLHILLSYTFVYKFNWGVPGAMASMSVCSWSLVLAEFVYIFGGWCPDAWKGFSPQAFADLLPVAKLSISSGFMIWYYNCLEMWYTSILVLVAGYMPNATIAIAAFSICLNINAWELMVCLGFLVASSVRVANELGRGNAEAVKFSIKAILGVSVATGLIFWTLIMSLRHRMAYLFSKNEEVADAVANLSILLAISVLLNSVQPTLSGVAVGAGMQSMVAIVNLGCYYVLGMPLGLLLGYVAHFQVKGLWVGMLGGVAMQTLILSIFVARTDWDDQVEKASQRLNRWLVKPATELDNDQSTADEDLQE